MKTILIPRKQRYLAKFSIFLITVALIAGMVGCTEHPFGEDLEIQTWYDLDAVRDNLGNHHTLMNDLDRTTDGYEELANAAAHRGKGWDPIGTWSARFTGSFDGQGYEIKDLFINRPNNDNVGLFKFVTEGGVIKNVGVVDVAVTGRNSVGGLVGENSGTVSNSYSSGSVTGDDGVGSLVGWNKENVKDSHSTDSRVIGKDGIGILVGWNTGTVSNSYSTGSSVTGDDGVGGLVGKNTGIVSNNSFSSGRVSGDKNIGGLVGDNQFEGTVSNSYSTGSVTGGDGVGGLVGDNTGNVSNSYSTGSVTGGDGVGGLVGENQFEGTVSNSYSTGSVSVENGVGVGGLVGENQFEGTVSNSYSTGSVSVENGVGVGGLVGINDGGTVSDSHSTGSVTGDENVGGLVGENQFEGTVSNSYSTGSVSGENGVGGLVGENQFEGTVSNSYSTGNVTGDNGVGGLVGNNYKGTMSNSHYNYNEVMINGQNVITIGALNQTDFDQWLDNNKFLDVNERLFKEDGYYVVNNVTDFKELIAFGQNVSLKFRLKNDLDLGNDPNFYIPYFAGEFDGNGHKISNLSFKFDFVYNVGLFGCLAPGGRVTQVGVENVNITGANFVGGLVGNNWEGTVRDSYSTGSMTGNDDVAGNDDVGGLVGSNDAGTVENCNSTCSVTGNRHVGGLVGCNYEESTVRHSYSTGSVSGNQRVGGLVGQNQGTVERSNSTGSVTGSVPGSVTVGDVVGGLVGWNEAIVSESYSTGSVSGDNHVGGLVGWNDKTVSNSYSTGSVTGDEYVGGLVGINDVEGTVNRTYSTGRVTSVTGDEYVGGLVGENYGDVSRISRSFWDTQTSGQYTSYGGTGKTTEKMQDIDTFTAWSITVVTSGQTNPTYTWNIVDGEYYPFLSWQPV
jgi:hypothetical protein